MSVVTVEEMIRGRLAVLRRRREGEELVRAYTKFLETVKFFGSVRVLPFNGGCEATRRELREEGVQIGTRDLRIAATALAHGLTVVTRNRRDFERVPGLALEDWTA